MPTITQEVTLDTLECGNCAINFAIPAAMLRRFKRTGEDFWCPNGHRISYSQTDYDKLKDELARKRAELDQAQAALQDEQRWRQQTERSLSATRGAMTRLKYRVHNGVCPCCKRHFVNLERHMHGQHPDWQTQERTP